MPKRLLFISAISILATAPQILGATGTTIVIQPAGKATWAEMAHIDSLRAKAAAVRQQSIPYMPGPKPRDISAHRQLGDRDSGPNPILINWIEIMRQDSLRATIGQEELKVIPNPPLVSASRQVNPDPEASGQAQVRMIDPLKQEIVPADVTSGPALIINFLALGDNNSAIPPDTHGAAGPNHLMTMLNTQVRIQDKTGAGLKLVSLPAFWFPLGNNNPFDPRIIYDPGSGRWMAICDANFRTASSSILFAISSTNDPTGTWTFYQIDADSTNIVWADFPDIGVNDTWIAITNNMFTISSPADSFAGAGMWVIDKSTALAGGPLTITSFSPEFDTSGTVDGFSLRPCLTFGSEPKLYIVDNSGWNDAGLFLVRISQITGTGPAPVWSAAPGSNYANTGLFAVANNFNFSQVGATQLGSALRVATNDPRMLNSVFRNGKIWCTHSGGFPPTGTPNRTSVFWYQLDPTAMPTPIVQSGVLDGGPGIHHFFPSITANAKDDALIGFSRSSTSMFVQAVYTSRSGTDPAGTMDTISVLKLGEDTYIKDFNTGNIRWGDYSATVVDPINDTSMWTIQEYAATDVGPNANDDRWGTWWGMVSSCLAKAGDASANGTFGLDDVIRIVNYIFAKPGFPSCPTNSNLCWLSGLLCRGDWNGDGNISLVDVIRGVNFIFGKPGGPWNPIPTGVCCAPTP